MTEAAVDVLIPAYNSAETIASAIQSIQRQTYKNLRILIVNDGSTDGTRAILDEIAVQDDRVSVLNVENGGIVSALNLGIPRGSAPLIARHDADDIAAPDRIEKQVAFLNQHPQVVAVSGACRHIDMQGVSTGEIYEAPALEDADPTWVPAREPYLIHPFLMVRRDALEAVGGYRYVFHAEDVDLYWRLQERGKLVNLPDVLGDYRINIHSVSGRSIRNGRIQALSAQLSAISAVRRRSNLPDLEFPADGLKSYEAAETLDELVASVEQDLTEAERRYLAVATAQKLNSLSTFRPYKLDVSDYEYITRTYSLLPASIAGENRKYIKSRIAGLSAALILSGHSREGFSVAPPSLFPDVLIRLVAKILIPRSALRGVRKLVKKGV